MNEVNTRKSRAESILRHTIDVGTDRQMCLVKSVADMHITDALVAPSSMRFMRDVGYGVCVKLHEERPALKIHPHALGQLCGVLGYPRTYVGTLQKGVAGIERELCNSKLVADLDWHARNANLKDRKGNSAKFLCRTVNRELRGYLSRSFKRHLASKPLLAAFLGACDTAGLRPVSATTGAINLALRCVLPQVFEPVDGEFIAIGASWSNSDFGAGRMKVSMFVYRANAWGGLVTLNDSLSSVHLGAVIEESDIELSEETYRAELDAQRSAVYDAVQLQMTPDNINRVLQCIADAFEDTIPWHRMRAEIGKVLNKTEFELVKSMLDTGYEELPPISHEDGAPTANRWWLSSAIGKLAKDEVSEDRAEELMQLAGSVLNTGKKAKKHE